MATIQEIKKAYIRKFYMLPSKLVEETVERFGDSVYTHEFLIFCAEKKHEGEFLENQETDYIVEMYEDSIKPKEA